MDTLLDFGQHIALGAAGACLVIILWIMAEGVVHRHLVAEPESEPFEAMPGYQAERFPSLTPASLKELFLLMHATKQITAVVSRPDALRKLKGQARYKVDLVGMEAFLRYVALASGWVEG